MKNSEVEVDIRPVESDGFIYPHSSDRQQTEESGIRLGSEILHRWKLLGSTKDFVDFRVAINVRGFAPVTMRENADRRNLGARISGAEPDGETSNHPQTPSPGGGLSFRRQYSPPKRQFRGDVRCSFGIEKHHKLPQ
jgi:hypothetical protein